MIHEGSTKIRNIKMYYFPPVYSSENLRPTIWQAMDKHEKITIYYIK